MFFPQCQSPRRLGLPDPAQRSRSRIEYRFSPALGALTNPRPRPFRLRLAQVNLRMNGREHLAGCYWSRPSGSSAAVLISTPIRRIRSPCCALAVSGHVAAAPPMSVMKSRRFTRLPRRHG